MAQLITTSEKAGQQLWLSSGRNNDSGPIPLALRAKKMKIKIKKVADILETPRIAVLTNLLMLVIRRTKRQKT